MSRLYQQLVTDHRNFRKILRVLNEEVSHYDDTAIDTDLSRVMEAIEYLCDYPQSYHHPIEAVAMNLLEQRKPFCSEALEKIRQQHHSLATESQKLASMIDMIYSDHVVPLSEIKAQLGRYYALQKEHLDTEDQLVFPLFEQYLDDADWDWITCQIKYQTDPLFDMPFAPEYQNISQRLALA